MRKVKCVGVVFVVSVSFVALCGQESVEEIVTMQVWGRCLVQKIRVIVCASCYQSHLEQNKENRK
jgi:hypothetical protein